MARVSNPDAKPEDPVEKLIAYLLRNSHVSPFEMVNMCVEINTTRDIGRQILRHRSFSFQEFSQRYSEVTEFVDAKVPRLQDKKNRQSSIETDDYDLKQWWVDAQDKIVNDVQHVYETALRRGIAKEVARVILPEGLTPTRMYMNGTFRSWIHYFKTRIGHGTQKEHEEVAHDAWKVFQTIAPNCAAAATIYFQQGN
jgi:thymidylate synthase (FAD)